MVGDGPAKRRRAVPGGLVAAVAIGIGRGEGVVVVDMTVGALIDLTGGGHLVGTNKGPAGGAVVKRRCQERHRVVTIGAIRRSEGGSRR